MCGIAGSFGWCDVDVLRSVLEDITHRGPDEEGTFVDSGAGVMLGATRLSIVDIEGGSQPMWAEDDSVVVVFNGEIYNHGALRERLQERGHSFRTNCDTEVLVHLWEEYGHEMPKHLDGMFAFALWDADAETIFLARDRLGIKPLYWTDAGSGVTWSSEIPPLLSTGIEPAVDQTAAREYLRLSYSPWPRTLFKDIQKLPPGCSLTVTDEGTAVNRYWQLTVDPVSDAPEEAANRIRSLFAASVQRRTMADVPVGAFLSGGLDSTAIVGLLTEYTDESIQTYSAAFPGDPTDESEEAQLVADDYGTDHHEVPVDESRLGVFDDIVRAFGEPLADPASIPSYLLSERAAKDVKVVLTGLGGDELFAGYERWEMIARHRSYIDSLPSPVFKAAEVARDTLPVGDQYFHYLSSLRSGETAVRNKMGSTSIGTQNKAETYLVDDLPESSELDRALGDIDTDGEHSNTREVSNYLIRSWLCDRLLYLTDHTSMAASLEARVPFLDHELVQYAYNVPANVHASAGPKQLLKRAVADIVPGRTLEREKQGFMVPVGVWLSNDVDPLTKWLDTSYVSKTPLLQDDAVAQLVEEHRTGEANHSTSLWRILNYTAWYDTHVDGR